MKFKLMVNCDEANHFCDKAQYQEASIFEKIKLNIHNLFCRLCREHTVKNTQLTRKIKKSKLQMLSTEEKNELKKHLQQYMA